jgi:hypothetical protein
MRLDPAEVSYLPLPAALVDRHGEVVAATPEWRGVEPGTLAYHTGQAELLVSAGGSPGVPEALCRLLLTELERAVGAMQGDQALGARVLVSSLQLVAGLPVGSERGTATEVLEHARAAIQARVGGVAVEVCPAPDLAVPAPARIALALVQFAANATSHQGATSLRLRVGPGPSFYVEWPSARAGGVRALAARHPELRRRWGLGYVRTVADHLGATAVPPGPTVPGWAGPCLSLGSRRLTLPLGLYAARRLVRATQTWEQELGAAVPEVRPTLLADLEGALADAEATASTIVRRGLVAARQAGPVTWAALPPETGPGRVREVLRGLHHERALWSAPEPHATRVHALNVLLARSLGESPAAFAPESFQAQLDRACQALGIPAPAALPMVAYPDPRLVAFLLAELGGELGADASGTWLAVAPEAARRPLGRALGIRGGARLPLVGTSTVEHLWS